MVAERRIEITTEDSARGPLAVLLGPKRRLRRVPSSLLDPRERAARLAVRFLRLVDFTMQAVARILAGALARSHGLLWNSPLAS